MVKRYVVTRVMRVIQSTCVKADSESQAVEISRKLKQKDWSNLDNKKRDSYKAVEQALG